jgi:hypothetical protein
MLDRTKADRIPEARSRSTNPCRSRPEDLDEFRRVVNSIADDFEAKLRTRNTAEVLEHFLATRSCLRRHYEPRWWFLLTGGLAAKEWLRRRGYSPAWSEPQTDDIFAELEGHNHVWCEDWCKNRIQ